MNDFMLKVLLTQGPCMFSVGQAGFIVKNSLNQLLAIDLYLSNCVERLEGHEGFKRLLPQIISPSDIKFDAIICTHAHWDHFDVDAIPEMVSKGGKLFCSAECRKLVQQLHMEYYEEQIQYVKPGDCARVGDFEIAFVECEHGDAAPDAVGVVVTVDEKRIYEVGDSCFKSSQIKGIFSPVDILIAPINGMYGNMNSEEVVEMARLIGPKLTIPCHYGMFASHGGDLKKFYDMMNEEKLPFLIMQQGEMYKL